MLRVGEQSRSVEVPKISCLESVEAEDLDETGDESLSRFVERIREKRRKAEKERNLSVCLHSLRKACLPVS